MTALECRLRCNASKTPFTTHSIRFQTSGLISRKDDPGCQRWLNAWNDVLGLRVFDVPPDIPLRLDNTCGLRGFYASSAQSRNVQVVDLEVREVKKVQVICLILKQPTRLTGTQYVGSVTLPYQNGSAVMKTQATQVISIRTSIDATFDETFPITRCRGASDVASIHGHRVARSQPRERSPIQRKKVVVETLVMKSIVLHGAGNSREHRVEHVFSSQHPTANRQPPARRTTASSRLESTLSPRPGGTIPARHVRLPRRHRG